MLDNLKEVPESDTMPVALYDESGKLIVSGRLPINVLAEYDRLLHCERHFRYAGMRGAIVLFQETKPAYLVSEF